MFKKICLLEMPDGEEKCYKEIMTFSRNNLICLKLS